MEFGSSALAGPEKASATSASARNSLFISPPGR
jgi:hypothetical protein